MNEPTTRELVVLDFETTGLVPGRDRTIEVAATLLVDRQPVDTFCRLMHPGFALPAFITSLTGITDQMLHGQPRPEEVMPALHKFVRGLPIVAYNASFDRAFLQRGPSGGRQSQETQRAPSHQRLQVGGSRAWQVQRTGCRRPPPPTEPRVQERRAIKSCSGRIESPSSLRG